MSRILLAAVAALVLIAPATATGGSTAQLRGTVAQKLADNHLVRVESRRTAHILRVPGSQARIRVGQRIELRGTTLRQRGHGSRVLARNVVVVRSVAGDGRDDGQNDDNSGPGRADDDDDDNSGPGKADDDDTGDTDDDSDDITDDDSADDDDSTDDD